MHQWLTAFSVLTIGAFAATSNAPVIGLLSQESYSVEKYFPDEVFKSYIAASYVKLIESAGGRVVPVWIGRDKDYYRDIIKNTNGIFFPGGATWFNETGGFGDAGQMLYDIALELNKNGDYYPVWGTCLGMELLMQVSIGGKEIRADCSASKLSLPLDFLPGYESSKLFSKAPPRIIEILKTENVTVNSHRYCLTRTNYTANDLTNKWRLISTNFDKNGLEFISAYESYDYPFFAVQFHPEKNPYEFSSKQMSYVDHGLDAILVSHYFADFFVSEARKNLHDFDAWTDGPKKLIYNYAPRYSGILGSSYEQVYVFTEEENNS